MNHNVIEKNGMYKKMTLFFANPLNIAVWTTFARLATEVANFVAQYTKLANYMQQHQADITGIARTKNNAFDAMVNIVVNKASKAYVWALDTGNSNLAGVFDIQRSEFNSVAEVSAFTKIKNIRDILSANIASMASVQLVAADLTAMNAAITTYQNTIGTTGAAQSHKTDGTRAIETSLNALDKSLGIIDKLMVSSYLATNADMVNEYLLNRAIDKLPTHHSGVYAHITDAATLLDIEGATLSIDGKLASSDIDGIAEIFKIRPNTYNVCLACPGYISQNMKMIIERGKVVELEVKFVKE